MGRAIRFYKEIFDLQFIMDQDGNVIMSKNNMTELSDEETCIERLVKKL